MADHAPDHGGDKKLPDVPSKGISFQLGASSAKSMKFSFAAPAAAEADQDDEDSVAPAAHKDVSSKMFALPARSTPLALGFNKGTPPAGKDVFALGSFGVGSKQGTKRKLPGEDLEPPAKRLAVFASTAKPLMMSKPSLLQEGKMEELEPATRRVNDQAMRAPPPRPPKKLDVPLQDVAELPYTYNIATLHSGFSKNDVSMTCRTKLDEVQQAAVSLMQDVHKRVLKAMETYNQAVQHACGETDKAFESFVKAMSSIDTSNAVMRNQIQRARDARDFFHSQAKLADDGQSIKEGVTEDADRALDKAAAT